MNQVADSISHAIMTHGGLMLDVGSALPGVGAAFSGMKVAWDIEHGDSNAAKIDLLMGAISATGLDVQAFHLVGTGLSDVGKSVLHYMQSEGGVGAGAGAIIGGGGKKALAEGEKTTEKTLEEESGRETRKVDSLTKLFEEEVFGQDLKENTVKTRGREKGANIYKVTKKMPQYNLQKNDHIYLDTQHYDHIEVFNGRGEGKHVLNLDGSVNAKKSVGVEDRILPFLKK